MKTAYPERLHGGQVVDSSGFSRFDSIFNDKNHDCPNPQCQGYCSGAEERCFDEFVGQQAEQRGREAGQCKHDNSSQPGKSMFGIMAHQAEKAMVVKLYHCQNSTKLDDDFKGLGFGAGKSEQVSYNNQMSRAGDG